MADAPVCGVCESKHWLSEKHIWGSKQDFSGIGIGDPRGLLAKRPEEIGGLGGRVEAKVNEKDGETPLETGRVNVSRKPKKDRKAYMREYMRRKRAKGS